MTELNSIEQMQTPEERQQQGKVIRKEIRRGRDFVGGIQFSTVAEDTDVSFSEDEFDNESDWMESDWQDYCDDDDEPCMTAMALAFQMAGVWKTDDNML